MNHEYISPINLTFDDIKIEVDNQIYKAVQNVNINVDRDELLKALRYDRYQYQKGFVDGKYFALYEMPRNASDPEYFCADAERRTVNDNP